MEFAAPCQSGSLRTVTAAAAAVRGPRVRRTATQAAAAGGRPGAPGGRGDGGRAGLDHVDGQPLPLRPGVVGHPGPVHRVAAAAARLRRRAPGGPDRVRAGPPASGQGPGGPRLQVRAGRDRLPQAALRRVPRRPGRPAAVHRRRPYRDRRRQLQRAEHQPHRGRGDDPQRRLRGRLPARRPRRRPADRLDAGRVRARPGVPGADGGGRADVLLVGAGPVPPVGPVGHRGRQPAHAVRQRVRVDVTRRPWPAHVVHGQPLWRRLADAEAAGPGGGGNRGVQPVPAPRRGRRDPQRAAAGRRRPRDPAALGHRDPPGLERPLRLAEVRDRRAGRFLRGRPVGRRGHRDVDHAAEPGHEPHLQRQGRLLHRHQAGAARGRSRLPRRRAAGHARLAGRRAVPGRVDRQGLAPDRLRRPSRRDHRHRGRRGSISICWPAGGRPGNAATWRARRRPGTSRARRTNPAQAVPRPRPGGRQRCASSTPFPGRGPAWPGSR